MPIATWKREQIARRPQSAGKKVNGYAWEQSHADTVSRRAPDLAAHVAARVSPSRSALTLLIQGPEVGEDLIELRERRSAEVLIVFDEPLDRRIGVSTQFRPGFP